MAFTNVWDNTAPADTQAANQLGADIRGLKTDIQERMKFVGNDSDKPTLELAFAGMIYMAVDTHKLYSWSGTVWTDITTDVFDVSSVSGGLTVVDGGLTVTAGGLLVSAGLAEFDDKIKVGGGVSADGSGLKHARKSITIPISSGGQNYQAGQAAVQVDWVTPFPDTSYTVVATIVGASGGVYMGVISEKTTGHVTVTGYNVFNSPFTGEVDVIAIHD